MITDAIDRFEQLHVLCVGDVMLDRFVYGDAARISPEAPIPVVRQTRTLDTLGGVGNAARNLHDLGARVTIVGVIGVDIPGSDIAALMAEARMDAAGILVDPARRTTLKTRIIARTQQMLRLDDEDTAPLSADIETRLCDTVAAAAQDAQAIILSDYGKGVLTPAIVKTAIEAGRKRGIPVLVDPKGHDYSLYKGATLVTPNLAELSLASGGADPKDEDDIVRAAQALMKANDLSAVIVTRSKDGMSVVEDHDVTHLPTQAREVYDVSGAGDTVIAVLALGLAAGLDLPDAARLANAAAGVVVAKLGTATLAPSELTAALHEGRGQTGKIMDIDHAAALVRAWHAQGLKVATTNGAFDILHTGHVTLLEQARDRADRLVVLVNSDASIKRYKDPNRPVNGQDARARVLASLASVDAVILFGDDPAEDDKPLVALSRLRGDVHVKGGDYALETLPETPVVRGWGGEMVILPFVDGFSTTGTIAKMRG